MLILSIPVLAWCCTSKKSPQAPVTNTDYKTDLMAADRAFSQLCAQKGMKYALMQYIDNKGVLLRPNTLPMAGAEAIDFISQGNDTSYTMTWEPNGGSVAQAGDLGYTYGVYSLKPNNKDTVLYGTYVSVWKKQPNGKWKFVLETGNDGISNE